MALEKGVMKKVRIGTRGSPLALIQARAVARMLEGSPGRVECEIIPITTRGDKENRVALWKVGGKGLFVGEIEERLLTEEVDIAVHSMKDVPGEISKGLSIPSVPVREDPRDGLLTMGELDSIDGLDKGAVVGTSSLRRRAQLLSIMPDIEVVDLRGNVGTRIEKLRRHECDAIILAMAGLKRLKEDKIPVLPLDPDDFVPAAGQGALALMVREGEEDLVLELNDEASYKRAMCERAFVVELGASCHSAVGAHAWVEDNKITITGRVLSPDGSEVLEDTISGEATNYLEVGKELAQRLLSKGAIRLLDLMKPR